MSRQVATATGAQAPGAREVLGQLERSDRGRLEGWCWSPAEPRERLVVDVYVNGVFHVAATAARMNTALRDRGVGDGQHWFSLPMPQAASLDAPLMIEARERVSQYLFGRLVIRRGPGAAQMAPRVDALAAQIRRLRHEIDGLATPRPAGLSPSDIANLGRLVKLSDLGQVLMRHSGLVAQVAASTHDDELAQGVKEIESIAAVRLPYIAAPALSLIVCPQADAQATAEACSALAPVLAALAAELILVDDGACPQSALLPTRIDNLKYLRTPGVGLGGAAMNAAARVARAERLVFVESMTPCAALFAELHGLLGAGGVAAGETVGGICQGLTPSIAMSEQVSPEAGTLRFSLTRTHWRLLGGFDEAFSADARLAAADMAHRACLMGQAVTVLRLPGYRLIAAFDPSSAELALFQRRWGVANAH